MCVLGTSLLQFAWFSSWGRQVAAGLTPDSLQLIHGHQEMDLRTWTPVLQHLRVNLQREALSSSLCLIVLLLFSSQILRSGHQSLMLRSSWTLLFLDNPSWLALSHSLYCCETCLSSNTSTAQLPGYSPGNPWSYQFSQYCKLTCQITSSSPWQMCVTCLYSKDDPTWSFPFIKFSICSSELPVLLLYQKPFLITPPYSSFSYNKPEP